jgi:hypothetical protein
MSLQTLSQQLASRGRDGDSMLVHMTPGEVQGLQALAMAHGGSLSINPDTGLPEAGFLKKILPTVAGAAITYLSGGAIPPHVAAMMVGGGTAIASGSLEKGLMAGLGAYGGAGLTAGLSGLGAQQIAAQQAAQQAAQFGAEAGIASYAPTVAPTGLEALRQGAQTAMASPEAFMSQLGGPMGTATTVGSAAAPFLSEALQPKTPAPLESPIQEGKIRPMYWTDRGWVAGEAYSPTAEDAEDRWKASMPSSRGFAEGGAARMNRFSPVMSAMSRAAPLIQTARSAPTTPGMTGQSAQAYRYLMGQGPAPAQIRPVRQKIEEPEWIKKKREEEAAKAAQAPQAAPAWAMPGIPAGMGGGFDPGNISGAAGGGLMALAKGGRYLRGAGDGTSDSIPASIEGKHPARLADGEFVIDARTVSEIGNGSSEAGAKKLYAMMDRVHAARRGAQRGKPSKADQYLVA